MTEHRAPSAERAALRCVSLVQLHARCAGCRYLSAARSVPYRVPGSLECGLRRSRTFMYAQQSRRSCWTRPSASETNRCNQSLLRFSRLCASSAHNAGASTSVEATEHSTRKSQIETVLGCHNLISDFRQNSKSLFVNPSFEVFFLGATTVFNTSGPLNARHRK